MVKNTIPQLMKRWVMLVVVWKSSRIMGRAGRNIFNVIGPNMEMAISNTILLFIVYVLDDKSRSSI